MAKPRNAGPKVLFMFTIFKESGADWTLTLEGGGGEDIREEAVGRTSRQIGSISA